MVDYDNELTALCPLCGEKVRYYPGQEPECGCQDGEDAKEEEDNS